MFKHKEAELVYSNFAPYLNDEAKARLIRVDASAKKEWNPFEVYPGLVELCGTASPITTTLGLVAVGGMYRPLSERLIVSLVPYEFLAIISAFHFISSQSVDLFSLMVMGSYFSLGLYTQKNILIHEFLHAASHQVPEPIEVTKRAKESGKGFETPTGLAWRDFINI